MFRLVNLLCGILLLAALFGKAHPDQLAHSVHQDMASNATLLQDALCGDGSGHGTCQLVGTETASFHNIFPFAGSSQYEITPVSASSVTLAPQHPPPRTLL